MTQLQANQLVVDIPERADGDELDFAIEPGQFWGVLGPNGAGKSTLLHTLAGLRRPRRGRVELGGRDIARLRRRTIARRLGVVFQDRQDSLPATVLETALIGRHPYLAPWDLETAEDVHIARHSLARLELAGMENRMVNTLSGGERQRLALATALTQQPDLWLADEPTNHLDLRHQVAVMRLLHHEAEGGRAVLCCLHDLNLAARWCSHLLLMYPDGRACWGKADTMLVPGALEDLYGQSLVAAEVDGRRVFVPGNGGSGP